VVGGVGLFTKENPTKGIVPVRLKFYGHRYIVDNLLKTNSSVIHFSSVLFLLPSSIRDFD